jgi:hypothetical protein
MEKPIKSLREIFKLTEIKSTLPDIEWVKTDRSWTSIIDIDDTKLKIEIFKELYCDNDELVTSINFYVWDGKVWQDKQTPNKNALKIIALVTDATLKYIHEMSPTSIVFLGRKSEASRKKVYERLLMMLRKYAFTEIFMDEYNEHYVFFATRIDDLENHPCKEEILKKLASFK